MDEQRVTIRINPSSTLYSSEELAAWIANEAKSRQSRPRITAIAPPKRRMVWLRNLLRLP